MNIKNDDPNVKTRNRHKIKIMLTIDFILFAMTIVTLLLDLVIVAFIMIVILLICVFVGFKFVPLDDQ